MQNKSESKPIAKAQEIISSLVALAPHNDDLDETMTRTTH